MSNFTQFPVLTTERLILRQLALKDADDIFFLRSDDTVNKYLLTPRAKSIADAIAFINKINKGIANNDPVYYWAITLKNDHKLIGTICFWNIVQEESKAEIGYVLHPAHQGKGIMQEAVTKVIEYGFDVMNLSFIKAVFHQENNKSRMLLERNAFVHEKNEGNEAVYLLRKTFRG